MPACRAAEAVLRLNLVLSAKVTHEGPLWKIGDLVYVKDPFGPFQDPAKLTGALAFALLAHETLMKVALQAG